MKNVLISILLSLFIFAISCNQSKVKTYYASGSIYTECFIKDSTLDGSFKEYYETGEIRIECNFTKNKVDGTYKCYYPNGGLKAELYYKNGDNYGMNKTYYNNGKISSIVKFIKNKENGVFKYFNEKGQLTREGIAVNSEVNYSFDYDLKNNTKKYTRNVVVVSKKDTIKLGETYSAKIYLLGPLYKNPSLKVKLNDTFTIIPIKNGVAEYNFVPPTQGSYNFSAIFYWESDDRAFMVRKDKVIIVN